MLQLYQIEWLKLKRQHLWIILILIPILGCLLGAFNFVSSYDQLMKNGGNDWYQLWTQMTFFYALILLPILSGIFAAFICRVDHLDGGWKLTLSLPVQRGKYYIVKFSILSSILLLSQLILISAYCTIGFILKLESELPVTFLFKAILSGWIATFPLAAIQLWLSIRTKSFSGPLVLNILLTFASLITMIMKVDYLYPWAQPSLAMKAPGENGGLNSYTLFFSIIIIMFIIVFFGSYRRFKKMDITF
ncbi:ABC transporter permease [Bacillus subtilis]|nr:ABC transporter permease [Bacillus subtilis]MDM5300291.1 ABC transporter permease [Bacillus subtilis]MDM5322344.1 ABC transporter permease [Bacillus subtilis]